MHKSSIFRDVPIQIACNILGIIKKIDSCIIKMYNLLYFFPQALSKIVMLRFFELLYEYLVPGTWIYTYMDTDSAYLAIAFPTLFECLKQELRHKFFSVEFSKWFPRGAFIIFILRR